MSKQILSTLLILFMFTCAFAQKPLWMRYPSISPDGTQIAFSYKGDIYKVSSNGGQAQRLTTNTAFDSNPIWSPDGSKIAFVSDREAGGKDIYLMSADGGSAKQLTTHSGSESPYTFTNDGKYVVFSAHYQDPAKSALFPTSLMSEIYKVSTDGGMVEMMLAFPAANINFNKSGNKFIYQDVKGMENTWRKHHTSSVTRDIIEYDIQNNIFKKIIDWQGEDTDPVYSPNGNSIYFLSERSGTYNLYSAPLNSPSDVKQHTFYKEHPVRFLTISNNETTCFGFDGEIYTLSPNSKEPNKVNIMLFNDLDDKEPQKLTFSSGATSADVSPDGKQVAFIVRGDVFVTSADYSTTKQITTSIAAESEVDFGPDNRTLIYTSYRNGKWNIYKASIGRKEDPNFPNSTVINEEELIKNNPSEKQNPQFSPDGKEVAFVMDRTKLMVYNLDSKKLRQITDGKYQHESDGSMTFSWSPDNKWFVLEYVSNNHAPYSNIGIVSAIDGGEIYNITNSGYTNHNPHWVMDGNAILFNSEIYGMRNHASWGSMEDVFIVFTNREAFNKYKMNVEEYELFTEAEKEAKKTENEEKDIKDKKEEKSKDIIIEFDNMDSRIVRLTSNSSRLGDAIINKDATKLYYMSAFEGGYDMWVYDLRKKSTTLLNKLNGGWSNFKTDKEMKNLFILSSSKMHKMEFTNDKFTPINYSAELKIDAYKEREFMYDFVYREEKERFYSTEMHGVDWDALTKHYRKFLAHINNNYDFSEMLSELLGELNVSHTGSGYRATNRDERTAELGLFISRVDNNNGLRIDEVIVNGPFDNFLSKVKKWDYIEKIDGKEILDNTDYFPLLDDKAGKNTLISIYSPSTGNRWDEVIKPISLDELNDLLYERWVKQREEDVERLSNGRLGYVHIPSMADGSFRQVYSKALGKYYEKEGIVIDIRYNGGGRLHEDLEVFFSGEKYLDQVVRGKEYSEMPSRRWNKPSVMLTTEADYSNAHGSPWVYKQMKIGKVVGMPVPGTMTSVNWVTLQDPSLYFGIPVVGYRTAEENYLENSQLEPDVKVSLDPIKVIKGEDSQLEEAVEVLLNEL